MTKSQKLQSSQEIYGGAIKNFQFSSNFKINSILFKEVRRRTVLRNLKVTFRVSFNLILFGVVLLWGISVIVPFVNEICSKRNQLKMLDSKKFFGVYIPKESNGYDNPNDGEKLHVYTSYDQAQVVLKEFKNARFKIFNSDTEACYFARNGSVGGQGNPNVVTESIPFKSLKRQDIYKFRRCIENGDYTSVKSYIWENPRYLISIGDTPTIMQEGPRYNALHIIAKHNRAKLAELILSTVSDPSFTKLLYGAAGENSYIVRPELLVDLYLNTPDKALNETPLHFAAKYGAVDVITVFVQYPQLKIDVKNKYGQTPRDLTCKQASTDNAKLSEKIRKMLNELFYVPVWRSSDDIVQPVIGKPYSPKSPPVCPGLSSPVSPNMEIKAIAGPMTYDEATNFHKSWKSPVRSACTSPSTPHISQGVLLRNPLEMERGLEKVGRTLATKFHVSWKEYWPFLDKFIDLRSEEGLKSLEEYLKQKIISDKPVFGEDLTNTILSPMSELCHEFAKFSINSPVSTNVDLSKRLSLDKGAGDAANSPYLLMENVCVVFSDNVLDTFMKHFAREMPIEDNVVALIKRVRHLMISLDSCRKDLAFKYFPFGKIHIRAALWITRKLLKLEERQLAYATATFNLIDQTDTSNMVKQITLSPTSGNVELEHIVQTLKCINSHVIKLLKKVVASSERASNEENCRKEWSDIANCQCDSSNGFLSKLHRFGEEVKKRLLFGDDDDRNDLPKNDAASNSKTNAPELSANDLADSVKKAQVTTNSEVNCDTALNLPNKQICDKNDTDSDDDEFYTPTSSLSGSDDEMDLPDEGPDIFIYNDKGTSLDNAVLEALDDLLIDPNTYPNICRWKHSVLLHNAMDRLMWPSPKLSKVVKNKNAICNGQ